MAETKVWIRTQTEGWSNSGQSQWQLRGCSQTNRSPQLISFTSETPRRIYKCNSKFHVAYTARQAALRWCSELLFGTQLDRISTKLPYISPSDPWRFFSFSKKMMPWTTRNPPTSKSLIIQIMISFSSIQHYHNLWVQSACYTRPIQRTCVAKATSVSYWPCSFGI